MRRVIGLRAVTMALVALLAAGTVVYAAETSKGTARHSWETRLQQELGLRDDQLQALRQIREREAQGWKQHGQALRQARAELRRLILTEADQPSIDAKYAQVQQLLTEGLVKRMNTLKEITPLLTPEQREKFAALMERGRHFPRHRQQS